MSRGTMKRDVFQGIVERLESTGPTPIDWQSLSVNPAMPVECALSSPHKPWNWKVLSRRASWAQLVEHMDLMPWDFEVLGRRTDVDWAVVSQHIGRPWVWSDLVMRPGVPLEVFERILELEQPWLLSIAFRHLPPVHIAKVAARVPKERWTDVFDAHPRAEWNSLLSGVDDATVSNMTYLPYLGQTSAVIPLTIVERCPADVAFAVHGLLDDTFRDAASRIPLRVVGRFCRQARDWMLVSQSRQVTWELVQSTPHWSWDWRHLSANPAIDAGIIAKAPFHPWDARLFMTNPNYVLPAMHASMLRVHSACVIQRAWRKCVADPGYVVCRRRLAREVGALSAIPVNPVNP
jgi:hypothetical protein